MCQRSLCVVIIALINCCALKVAAQSISIGPDVGFYALSAKQSDRLVTRRAWSDYQGDYSNYQYSNSEAYSGFGGIKIEYRYKQSPFRFTAGIRYTMSKSRISKEGTPNYMFLLYKQDGNTTDYLRVHDFSQLNSYIGLPLEARFYAFPGGRARFKFYFATGVVFNVLISHSNTVNFQDPSMNSASADVKRMMGNPQGFNFTMYAGFGVRIGRIDGRAINVGTMLPAYAGLTTSTIVNTHAGGGMQIFMQVPIRKSE